MSKTVMEVYLDGRKRVVEDIVRVEVPGPDSGEIIIRVHKSGGLDIVLLDDEGVAISRVEYNLRELEELVHVNCKNE